MHAPGPVDLSALSRLARRAERRLRLVRALEEGTRALAVALVFVLVTLVLRKTSVVSERSARVALALAAAGVGVALFAAYRRRLPERAGAVALDRHHGLSDRLSSALAFGASPDGERTAFMVAAIEDACAHAGAVDPRAAVPLRRPADLPFAFGLLAVVALVGILEVRAHVPARSLETLKAVDVTADDLDAMREFLREMDRRAETEEAKAATLAFNQLIEDLAARRLDRTEAFRRMQALEDKLLEGREADAKALEAALEKMGEELKKADLTKAAGEALETQNLAVAEKALRDLAKRLREQGNAPDKAQLERMREALKRAAESQTKRKESLAEKREDLKKQLLKEKQRHADAGAEEAEKSLLKKKERELERLERELEEHESAQRKLDRLDRELAQAAEDLMKDLGLSAQDLEQGAEDVRRMAQKEMSQEEKEQLRKKLQELREMMRQQGQGGEKQMMRLRRFQQAARGGTGGRQRGDGQDGQGGKGQEGKEGQEGEGQEGQGQGQGQGKPGEVWVLGPNGEKMMVLSSSRRAGSGTAEGGDGKGESQKGYGTGHDEKVQGGATSLKGQTQDSQLAGQDTGQGQSRSEVIHGAAERGFTSRGYEKVYREYETVAEEALNRDEIPGGYRFYVRRYFQLIRPREESK